MKHFLVQLALLSLSLPSFALSVECSQGDGDDWYALKSAENYMVVVHTIDDDLSEIIHFDNAEYFSSTETVSSGRYILSFGGQGQNVDIFDVDASFYKLEGQSKVLLSDIMECFPARHTDIESWLEDFQLR